MFKNLFNIINNLFPYKMQGKNNKIYVTYNGRKKKLKRKLDGLNVSIHGVNNYLEIELPISFKDTNIELAGENAVCIIKKTPIKVNKASIYVSSWGRCFIDEGIWLNQPNFNVIVNNNERFKPHKLVIGKRAQLRRELTIRTSDGHSIFNAGEKLPYNEPQDVIIGDDVWIAQRVTLIKGAQIPSNCVVGACSLVNKKFEEEGCIIAGNPAKVIKRNIRWKFDSYGFVTNKYKQNSSGDKKIKYMIIKRLKHKFLKFVFRFYF